MTSYIATEIVRLRPHTKERFLTYVGDGMTADRAMIELLNIAKVPK